MAVFTIGPAGSSGKNGSFLEGGEGGLTAAAVTYRRWMGVIRVARGRSRAAARREAMVVDWKRALAEGKKGSGWVFYLFGRLHKWGELENPEGYSTNGLHILSRLALEQKVGN